jgi:hypothetical protein
MRRGSRLKISVLGSVSLFVLGFWCNVSAAPVYRPPSGSVLASPSSLGSPSFCSESSLAGFDFLYTSTKSSGLCVSGNAGVVGEFFVFSPIDGLSIKPDPLSGRDRLSFPKVSLQILNSVFIL